MTHLDQEKKKQYITTFTVNVQTSESIHPTYEYKSQSSLVPCLPRELKAGVSSQCESFSYVKPALMLRCVTNIRNISLNSMIISGQCE